MTDPSNPYAAPGADAADYQSSEVAKPTWSKLLFSFEGRIPRRLYWGTRGIAVLQLMMAGAVGTIIGNPTLIVVLMVPAYIALLWITLAGSVKRWHDLNKSGYWILIAMVPLIGGIWELIEAGCLRGTRGSNDYGADPT